MRVRKQRLPIGYKEVEYLESTGTQWIDTNYTPTQNTKTEIDLQGISVGQYSSCIFGYRNSNISSDKYAIWIAVNTLKFAFNLGSQDTSYVYTQDITTRCRLTMSKNGYYYNNTFLASCTNNATFQNLTATIFVMRSGSSSVDNRRAVLKLYGLRMWENDSIVRNFVPCIRTSDSKPGLYDVVNSVFYTNSGTGEFLYGPYNDSYNISSHYKPN